MIWRALAVWLVILVLANLNGAVRELWIIPQIGELSGRALSTLILCGLVFFLTWRTIGWIRPVSAGEAVEIGVLWLLLTLAFEFLVGTMCSALRGRDCWRITTSPRAEFGPWCSCSWL
jgi:hypothetical protein